MKDLRDITLRAIHDALALRGPGEGGGMMRTAPIEHYMSGDRLRLAQEVLRHLPADASATAADALVAQLVPVVSRLVTIPIEVPTKRYF